MADAGIGCDHCSWKGRSSRYPWHVISKHLGMIHLHANVSDNCISGHTAKDGVEQEFLVCLTCKGGGACSPMSVVGDRWTSWHAKKKACQEAHPTAYARFKQLWVAARGAVVEAEKTAREAAAAAVAATSAGGVGELWTRCRGDRRMGAYLQEVEKRLQSAHEFDEEDGPFVFDPVAGFESVIAEAMSGQKTVRLTERKLTEMTVAHNHELTEQRRTITDQQRTIELHGGRLIELTEEKRELHREVTDLQETVTGQKAQLEELSGLKETVTGQKAQLEELSGLKETVTQQGAKMQGMHAEIQALRAELAAFTKS
jgi:hypothetical protein